MKSIILLAIGILIPILFIPIILYLSYEKAKDEELKLKRKYGE